jgi:hypothetical protein
MTIQQIIASFDASELAFYQECAARVGETLEEWVAHMDEI